MERRGWTQIKGCASEERWNCGCFRIQQGSILWPMLEKSCYRDQALSCWWTQGRSKVALYDCHKNHYSTICNHSTLNERDLILMYCIQHNIQVDSLLQERVLAPVVLAIIPLFNNRGIFARGRKGWVFGLGYQLRH